MAKMTLEELRSLRNSQKKEMEKREAEGKEILVNVGMGTCGIAAGAKDALNAILDEIDLKDVKGVVVKQTGCMGLCYVEPTVEVAVPGMPQVIYGKMTQDVAKDLVKMHLVEHKLLDNHIFDRPAADIMKK